MEVAQGGASEDWDEAREQGAVMAIRVSKEQARRLGITTPVARGPRVMNKLEAKFAAELEAWKMTSQIDWWTYEGIKLRLAKGAYFKPDFFAVKREFNGGMNVTAYETKGFLRESANVRIKVAAETFPWIRFVIVRRVNGEWKYSEVGR